MATMTSRHLFMGALVLAAGAHAALAQGLVCGQDCSSGACAQSECTAPAAGSGACECGSGSVPLGGDTYAAYCRAWGQWQPGCGQASPQGQSGNPPTLAVAPAGSAMDAALFSQNPYVGLLVAAMRDGGGNWASAPVKGLIHDIHYDAATGQLSQGAAVAFAAAATSSAGGGFQVDIALQGDAGQLGWLKQSSLATAPAAVVPASIHGVVTAGGLHGNLVVLSAAGQSQTVLW